MLPDDPVADRKAQAGAVARGFGGIERLEDPAELIGSDAFAAVGNAYLDKMIVFARGDLDHPGRFFDRIEGVQQQVEPDALQVFGAGQDGRQIGGEIELQQDASGDQLVLDELDGAGDRLVDIDQRQAGLFFAGKIEQIADDQGGARAAREIRSTDSCWSEPGGSSRRRIWALAMIAVRGLLISWAIPAAS